MEFDAIFYDFIFCDFIAKEKSMRIAFVLPGLHRIIRGAEVAFESIAQELANPSFQPFNLAATDRTAPPDTIRVTLFGSGDPRANCPYQFIPVANVDRVRFESWPQFPLFRNEYVYEELTFGVNLLRQYRPQDFDVTVTCSYPFLNWLLRAKGGKQRPAHVFVTQNGDYPAYSDGSEYRFFGCNGLICTNPEYFERNQTRWPSCLIPNGVDPDRFSPGEGNRPQFNLPTSAPVALMVSALIGEKRVMAGIEAAAPVENLHLLVCGDGPEREKVQALGKGLMPGRFQLQRFNRDQMPDVYRSADLLLHMSLTEPSANAYIEALATGLPIVTHDRAVTRWTLEDTSILVDATETAQVTAGIYQALQSRSAAAIATRRDLVARRFTWRILAQEYYKFFTQVLSS
jgi:glycosyltransferase involved in cell wall biosynthesis